MKQAQKGMVLITVLIFLLVLSLLSLSALNTSQLQVHMSYNLKDSAQTLQAAETGLVAAEKQLISTKKPGCFSAQELSTDKNKKPWLQQANTCQTKLAGIPVKYFIEQLVNQPCRTLYQITAWTNDNYSTIVQNIYAVAINTSSCEKSPVAVGQLMWRELN
jgi:Tfp pilus assembly protein PilX